MTTGITIVLGNFNPPATPAETNYVPTRPTVRDNYVKPEAMQWQSMPQTDSDTTGTKTAELSFVSGVRKFRDLAAPTGPASTITSYGVRYVGNGSHAVASQSAGLWTCVAAPATPGGNYTASGLVEVGSITIGGGGNIRIRIPYQLTIVGSAPDVAHSILIEDRSGSRTAGTTGFLEIDVRVPDTGASSAEATIGSTISIHLLRNGSIYDTIVITVPIHYAATIDGTGGEHVHTVAATLSDNLFGGGLSSDVPYGTLPAIPFTDYIRKSAPGEGMLIYS